MASFSDKSSFITICLVMVLLPLVSHAGGLGVAPLIFVLGVLGLLMAIKTKQFDITPVQIALVVLLSWLSLSALWSPYHPDDFLTNYIKLFLMGMIFYWAPFLIKYVGRKYSRILQHLFMGVAFFGTGLLIIDLLSNYDITLFFNPAEGPKEKTLRIIDAEQNLGHSITIWMLLTGPLLFLMRECLPKKLGYFAIAAFLIMLFCAAWINNLAVGVGGVICVIIAILAGYKFPRKTPSILLSLVILAIMAAPALAYLASFYDENSIRELPLSWEHRLKMWGYCWHAIAEAPLQGAGFDASRTYTDTYMTRIGVEMTIVSLHPHNAGVQIWLEAGFVGALLASFLILTLFKPVMNFVQSPSHAGAVSGVIMAVLIISSLTYGAWQFWWWASVFLAIGALYLLPDSTDIHQIDDE